MMPPFIDERLRLARGQLKSAKRNLAEGDLETASNRAFLAAENAAAAAIARSGEYIRPVHGKIRSQFGELCDRGIIPNRFRDILSESYRFRLKGDYGRRIHEGQTTPALTPDAVRHLIGRVSDLLAVVDKTIGSKKPRRS
jgi:uncharacterized protein (UPF0332 family)